MAEELYRTRFFNDVNLVSYWRMEGNSRDSRGSNDGTDTTMTYGTSYGKFGQGAYFNGAGYITCGNASIPIGTSSRTMCCWAKKIATVDWGMNSYICWGSWFYSNYCVLAVYGDVLYFWGYGCDVGGTTIIQNNIWYHFVITLDSGVVKLYVNGKLDGQASLSFNTASSSVILGSSYNTAPMYGYLDDVAIFSRALSDTEVYNLYNGDKTKLSFGENVGSGKLPCGDDSSIGLNTWPQFKALMDRSVDAGKLSNYDVVSTYSIINPFYYSYCGGVLSANGDIHFVPYYAFVGQKISSSGIVSTYSLVYTCLLYTSPSPRDRTRSRMPSSA